jgi:NADH-quinone oxidoreductase subunit C
MIETSAAKRIQLAVEDTEIGSSADGIPFARVPVARAVEALRFLRDTLGFERLVDLTAVDYPDREDRFELNYLVYSMPQRAWFRLKARTAGEAPSGVTVFAGLNWYEREVYDLFGVRFADHPNLQRIMLPDNWKGHPLRRDAPIVWEPVEFSQRRQEQDYGG